MRWRGRRVGNIVRLAPKASEHLPLLREEKLPGRVGRRVQKTAKSLPHHKLSSDHEGEGETANNWSEGRDKFVEKKAKGCRQGLVAIVKRGAGHQTGQSPVPLPAHPHQRKGTGSKSGF